MELSLVFWLTAIVGVILTGISKSGFAGGAGVIAVPLLSLIISPIQAAAIMLPLLLVMDFFSVKAWWGKQLNDYLKLFIPPALLGIVVGYFMFDVMDEEVLKILLGVLSLVFAIWGLANGFSKVSFASKLAGRVAGGVAGFTSFVAHAGGPPLNFYLIPQKLPREQFLATAVIFYAVINVVKLIPYAALGQLNFDNLLIALILVPVAWIGVKLGLIIQQRLSDDVFYRVILIMLLIVGAKLMWDGSGL
jgi:uncharacterized membrane protein YfcA